MKILKEEKNNYVILNIEGSLSVETISGFQETMNKYLDKQVHVLLNLSEVTFIDSSTLGMTVLYFTKLENIGKHLLLIQIKNEIYQMFNLTGISKRINIFKTIEDAIEFLEKE